MMKLLISLLILGLSVPAFAAKGGKAGASGFLLKPSAIYWSQTLDTGTSKVTNIYVPLTIAAGYILNNGLYIGGIYEMYSDSTEDNSGTAKKSRTGYGPTLGYVSGGFHIEGSYILAPVLTQTDVAGIETKYFGGTGLIINLGYHWMLSDMIGFGPAIAYQSYDYKKVKQAGGTETDLTSNVKQSEILPYLSLWVIF